MLYFIFLMTLSYSTNPITIFDFNEDSNLKKWNVVNDDVMGGRSSSNFIINEEGFGEFSGIVSLENNGGFSSLRHKFQPLKVNEGNKISIKLKGDGKNYQLRIKDKSGNYYSYISTFKTSGEWEKITILIKDMYPSFRGRKLNSPNFSHENIEEIVFLIGNKKNESFKLIIDTIELE